MSRRDLRRVVGLRLREARLRRGLTQAELGRQAGLDPSVASPRMTQYESGQHLPRAEVLSRLASVLGVPVSYLMAEDEGLATLILNWQAMTPEQRAVLIAAADQVVRAGDTRPPP
ncbi:helix-turn-helix domain-containing protein [Novilysobacter defluvii]|uniref:Transcriptional regulator n=1 Tax=Lysobacter defluvii IMMIB APB-9 = DSM 18482 TaxID=1385515 RepID=A0A0A0M9J6_9GAMM|nr:helix-turn-helix transcriptional regulator [Lysobacter defluvii]KGO99723.1 transcriptional regulator [Lysobacter defluvii IMMIB APB-9 = DSM 18482]